MSTFNGWEIISLPSTPSAPASVEFSANDVVAQSISPFTGQAQIQNWQAGWLEASVSYPAMLHSTAQAWIAFLMALQGSANIFQLGDPLGGTPQGVASGSPQVDGASQTGFTLATKGWTTGVNGILAAGDWIQIGYRLYRNLTAANSDGSGKATLSIWPQLRESPADSDSITVSNTKGIWRLKTNQRKWSISQARLYGIQFEIREAI